MPITSIFPTKQVFVNATNPTTNFFAEEYLALGPVNSSGAFIDGICNTWLEFDLSSFVGASINSATLVLTSFYSSGNNYYGYVVLARQVTDNSWTQTGITWNNAPNASIVNTPNAFDGTFGISGDNRESITLDVKALVSAALAAGAISFIITTINDSSSEGFGIIIDGNFGPGGTQEPQLNLDYTPPSAASSNGFFFLVK